MIAKIVGWLKEKAEKEEGNELLKGRERRNK